MSHSGTPIRDWSAAVLPARSAISVIAIALAVATSVTVVTPSVGCASSRPEMEIASTHTKGEVHVVLTDRSIDQIDSHVRNELRRMQRDVMLPERGYTYEIVDADKFHVNVRIREVSKGEIEIAVHVTDSPNRQPNTARAKETLNRLLDAIY